MVTEFFPVGEKLLEADRAAMGLIAERLDEIEQVMQYNQLKMLKAFTNARFSANHMFGSTGYGYDDPGREKLEQIFAEVTGSEAALFRHNFMSGTHAISVALFGVLRPGDTMLCASGRPYDTLIGVIGHEQDSASCAQGNLADFGVKYRQLELAEGKIDIQAITESAPGCKMLYIQRSRGYSSRPALTLEDIENAAKAAKAVNPDIAVVVDNCYGEFTRCSEPTAHGADLIIGSLIKNPGGGIAPTGGYIAGRKDLVELCAQRLSAPGIGGEVGSVSGEMIRQMALGLYFAPGVTAEALKTAVYASALFETLGCEVTPRYCDGRDDIITAIVTGSPEKLVELCCGIQSMSPVDSYVSPEPWPMPGYGCDIIMAAGAFTLGSSIELSCDAPMAEPYTAYMQGGLNFSAGRAAVLVAADRAFGPASE